MEPFLPGTAPPPAMGGGRNDRQEIARSRQGWERAAGPVWGAGPGPGGATGRTLDLPRVTWKPPGCQLLLMRAALWREEGRAVEGAPVS